MYQTKHDNEDGLTNNTNFAYYSMHDFHKLTNTKDENSFSLIHTNVQSLEGNLEKIYKIKVIYMVAKPPCSI